MLLVYPPISKMERYGSGLGLFGGNQIPLGIFYLASYLREHGVPVHAIDGETRRLTADDIVSTITERGTNILGISSTTVAFHRALELARAHHYAVALVDFALPDMDGWAFIKELTEAKPAIEYVIVTKARASLGERARGWFAGAKGFFDKPPHPGKLQDLLHKV